jgi:hypothetical protein
VKGSIQTTLLWSSTQVCNRAEDVQGLESGGIGICEEDPKQRCSRRLSICTEGLNTDDVAVVVNASLQSPENVKGGYCQSVLKDPIQRVLVWWLVWVLSICTEGPNTEDVGMVVDVGIVNLYWRTQYRGRWYGG